MPYKNYFHIEEFLIKPDLELPLDVINKLLDYHIPILNDSRIKLSAPIIISDNSGYRPKSYELSMGRSGNSQHTFKGKGAVDITTDKENFAKLVDIMMGSDYKRICIYNTFIHCDFYGEKKKLFYEDDGRWIFRGYR